MAGKYKITIEQMDEDYENNAISFTKDYSCDPTWTDLLGTFANCLSGLGYILSDDTKYIFENLDSENAEKIAKFLDSEEEI